MKQHYKMVLMYNDHEAGDFITALDENGFADVEAIDAQLDVLDSSEDGLEYKDQEESERLLFLREKAVLSRRWIVPSHLIHPEVLYISPFDATLTD